MTCRLCRGTFTIIVGRRVDGTEWTLSCTRCGGTGWEPGKEYQRPTTLPYGTLRNYHNGGNEA